MKYRILGILILCICFSAIAFAQENKPVWITSLENTIQQKEPKWKIEDKIERGEDGSYNYSYTFRSGKLQSSVQIDKINNISNPEETFDGQAIAFDRAMGKGKKKIKLQNFGDEGYIWANLNKDGWTMIKFRKGDIFVIVYAPSEKTARQFAQYVVEQMP